MEQQVTLDMLTSETVHDPNADSRSVAVEEGGKEHMQLDMSIKRFNPNEESFIPPCNISTLTLKVHKILEQSV